MKKLNAKNIRTIDGKTFADLVINDKEQVIEIHEGVTPKGDRYTVLSYCCNIDGAGQNFWLTDVSLN